MNSIRDYGARKQHLSRIWVFSVDPAGSGPLPACVCASQAMDKSLNTLTPLCDFVARINNEGHEPTLVAFETVDTKGNWRVISDRFARRAG